MKQLHQKITTVLFVTFIGVMCVLCLYNNRASLIGVLRGLDRENIQSIDTDTEKVLSSGFPYKKAFIDINGAENTLLGRRAIEDGSVTVIKDRKHRLHTTTKEIPVETILSEMTNVISLNDFASKKDIPFLYIQAPFKADAYKEDLPYGIEDFSREAADNALDVLNDAQVPFIDLRQEINDEDAFYNTDHHWRIETAFKAAQIIAARLSQMPSLKDIDNETISNAQNYEINTLPNVFMGSLGRRVGAAYGGMDDFSYILPKFSTSLRYRHKKDGEVVLEKHGDFKTALISDPAQSDYYCSYLNNSYCEMIIENELSNNENKLLIISDSFGRPFASYMSLYFKTTVNVDTQKGRFKDDLYKYIQEYEPDAVIVLFNSGMYNAEDVFQFGELNNAIGCKSLPSLDAERAKEVYHELLKSIIKGSQGEELLNILHEEPYQGIAYLLRSEVIRYNGGEDDAKDFICAAVDYLLEHSDDDGDGEPGWGLKKAWDAFADGSENSAQHVYAIEVSNVLDALMDALETDVLNARMQVFTVMRDITLVWHEKYWTQSAEEGECFYWYSISPEDEIECANISAKMAGTFARCCKTYPELFSEEESIDIWRKINQTMYRLAQLALQNQEYDDCVAWQYCSSRNPSYNDAIHHAFIIEGILSYQMHRNTSGMLIPWSEADLLGYLYKCLDENSGFLYSYPEHTTYRMYDAGAIPLFKYDSTLQGEMLMQMLAKYGLVEKEKIPQSEKERAGNGYTSGQLAFLVYALADYAWQ